MKTKLLQSARWLLPRRARRFLVRISRWPPVGMARGRILNDLVPVSRSWGGDRGLPIDRYYIERFLAEHAGDVQGRVLEIGDNQYTMKYGGERVMRSDVLDVETGNPKANIVADLTHADHLSSGIYDCIVCTQTLQLIYNTQAALVTLSRVLKPGGVLLVTIPAISQIARSDTEHWADYWRFTSMAANLLFGEVFPPEGLVIRVYGNVLVTSAFLYGLATEELSVEELDYNDPDYEFLITVRAAKPRQIS